MKKLTIFLLAIVLFTVSFSCFAYDVDNANDKIYKKIEQAQKQAVQKLQKLKNIHYDEQLVDKFIKRLPHLKNN